MSNFVVQLLSLIHTCCKCQVIYAIIYSNSEFCKGVLLWLICASNRISCLLSPMTSGLTPFIRSETARASPPISTVLSAAARPYLCVPAGLSVPASEDGRSFAYLLDGSHGQQFRDELYLIFDQLVRGIKDER